MRIRSFFCLLAAAAGALASRGCGGDTGSDSAGGPMPGGFGPPDGGGFAPECVNLCRQQATCIDGTTALTGTVMDPAGKLPIYNAVVYVPNAAVPPFGAARSCDRCGTVPGSPLVSTLTDANGHFVLKDVPAGKDIPIVVQIGKWRRQLVVPQVVQCVQTTLSNIRLPRNHCEGDIPQMAVTTGADDAMECWLRKVGLDDTEFTTDAGRGRVHLYAGSGTPVTSAFDPAKGGQSFTSAEALWSETARLARYDIVLLSCEGQLHPETKPPAALAALKDYAAGGGRLLASHWHRFWFDTRGRSDGDGGLAEDGGAAPSAFVPFATWNDRVDPAAGVRGQIETTAPKGAAMRLWLADPSVAALDAMGQVPLPSARHNADSVDPSKATPWVTFVNTEAGGQKGVALLSSTQQCGRVAFADFHGSPSDASGAPWPAECGAKDMTEEQKALEFAFFDLASCVEPDGSTPAPPQSSTSPCTKCALSDLEHAPPQTAIGVSSCTSGDAAP